MKLLGTSSLYCEVKYILGILTLVFIHYVASLCAVQNRNRILQSTVFQNPALYGPLFFSGPHKAGYVMLLWIKCVGSCYCCCIMPFSKVFLCGVHFEQWIILWGPCVKQKTHKGLSVAPPPTSTKKITCSQSTTLTKISVAIWFLKRLLSSFSISLVKKKFAWTEKNHVWLMMTSMWL